MVLIYFSGGFHPPEHHYQFQSLNKLFMYIKILDIIAHNTDF